MTATQNPDETPCVHPVAGLTRPFEDTIIARLGRDPEFARALLRELNAATAHIDTLEEAIRVARSALDGT